MLTLGTDGILRIDEPCHCYLCFPGGDLVKAAIVSKLPTPWALDCPYDGLVYLTWHTYTQQKIKDDWYCPMCQRLSAWNTANYQHHIDSDQTLDTRA